MSLLETPPRDTSTGAAADGGSGPTPRPSAPTAKAAAWLAILAVIVAAISIPRADRDGLGAGSFGRVLAGSLERLDDDRWVGIPVGDTVPSVATIRTLTEPAELEVRGGAVTLARGTRIDVRGDRLGLESGSVLVESEQPYSVALGVVEGRGRGAWRVDAGGASRFGVYRGGIGVREADGPELGVASLRQVNVGAGSLADRVEPLRYLATGPWDRRLLADAIAIDAQLRDVHANLEDTYGTALQEPDFYRDFAAVEGALDGSLDRLAPEVDGQLAGPPAPTLIGVVVADLLVRDARLSVDSALEAIVELRTAGAPWGLIVVDHDLGPADVRSGLDRALRRRAVSVAEGTATPPRGTRPARGQTPTPEATPSTPPEEEPRPREPEDPEPTDPPEPTPPPEEDEPGRLDPVEETVSDLGALLDPVPGGPALAERAEEAIDTIDDLLPPPGPLVPPASGSLGGG